MSDLVGERWNDKVGAAISRRRGGPCSRQREERVPRPRDGTELVLTEEQAGVDGWALEGATGGRSVVV